MQGVQISGKVAETLNRITQKIHQVDELVAEVADGSHEQAQGIIQINQAMGQLDKVTQGNAANAEQSAAAAQELNGQVVVVSQVVAELGHLVSKQGRSPGTETRVSPVQTKNARSSAFVPPQPATAHRNGGVRTGARVR